MAERPAVRRSAAGRLDPRIGVMMRDIFAPLPGERTVRKCRVVIAVLVAIVVLAPLSAIATGNNGSGRRDSRVSADDRARNRSHLFRADGSCSRETAPIQGLRPFGGREIGGSDIGSRRDQNDYRPSAKGGGK